MKVAKPQLEPCNRSDNNQVKKNNGEEESREVLLGSLTVRASRMAMGALAEVMAMGSGLLAETAFLRSEDGKNPFGFSSGTTGKTGHERRGVSEGRAIW